VRRREGGGRGMKRERRGRDGSGRGGQEKGRRERKGKGSPPIISHTPQFRFSRNMPGFVRDTSDRRGN